MKKFKLLFSMLVAMLVIASCSKDKYDAEAQMKIDEALIIEHITKNNIPAVRHSSGLYYQIIQPGTGKEITSTSNVNVSYEGRLLNGTIFDSTLTTGSPVTFNLGQVIKGWTIGLPLIKEFGEIRLIVPSPLAYGKDSPGPSIPAKSILDFRVIVNRVP